MLNRPCIVYIFVQPLTYIKQRSFAHIQQRLARLGTQLGSASADKFLSNFVCVIGES